MLRKGKQLSNNAVDQTSTSYEKKRLLALARLKIDETKREERLDRITRVAASLFDVPIAMINLVTTDRIRFKSCVGLNQGESIARGQSFCSLAADQDEPLQVQNALLNEQFKDNPLVLGDLQIRSYTGKSLHSRDGFRVGTLCLLDKRPRKYSTRQLHLLDDLSKWAESELNAGA